jgi:hypothetical protein
MIVARWRSASRRSARLRFLSRRYMRLRSWPRRSTPRKSDCIESISLRFALAWASSLRRSSRSMRPCATKIARDDVAGDQREPATDEFQTEVTLRRAWASMLRAPEQEAAKEEGTGDDDE